MRPIYFLLFFLVLFTSCTPLRVVRLDPAVETEEYSYGQKIVRQTERFAEVAVSYYDASQSYLVFNVSVENKGDQAINFDPASCVLSPDIGVDQLAVDPEFQLLSMDMESMRQIRKNRTLAWVGAGLMVAGAVAGAGIDGGEGGINSLTLAEELAFTAADVAVFAIAQNSVEANRRNNPAPQDIPVPENRFFWLDHALRITTIQPGEVAFGKVVFLRNDAASSFNFKAMVDGYEFSVPFTQKVFR